MKNPADISKNRIFLPSDVFACFCWNQSMQKHPIYTVLRNTSLPLFKYFKIIIIVSEFQESHLERCGFKSWNVPAQVWSPGGKSWRLCIQGRIMGTLGPGRTSTMGPLGIIITITLLCNNYCIYSRFSLVRTRIRRFSG